LAISIEVPSISSCPRQITQKKGTATILSEILRISKKDILEKLERNRSFEWIKRKVTPEEINRVKNLICQAYISRKRAGVITLIGKHVPML